MSFGLGDAPEASSPVARECLAQGPLRPQRCLSSASTTFALTARTAAATTECVVGLTKASLAMRKRRNLWAHTHTDQWLMMT